MNDRSGDFLAGLVVGGFLGAAAALLLAPQRGDETIAQLREKGIELKERAADISAEAMRRVNEMENKSKLAVEEQKGRLEEAVEEGKRAAEARREEMLDSLKGQRS
jgi:gas vesicle protein